MAAVEINPPEVRLEKVGFRPVVFLAGPIQGAPDWQTEAVDIISSRTVAEVIVANPRTDDYRDYESQVSWEQRYLRRAKKLGGIAFWCPAETTDCPSPNPVDRSYAQTTRIEFGKVTGWLDYDSEAIVSIGIEEGYSGSDKYYRYDAEQYGLPIHSTLDETITHLLRKVEAVYGPI